MKPLFHYCPASSFVQIIQNKAIWLSSLKQSNDSQEGKVLSDILLKLLGDANVSKQVYEEVKHVLEYFETHIDGLGFCLSWREDRLSQWRGYAENGSGFAIGFSREYLAKLEDFTNENGEGFAIKKVIYNKEKQEELVKPTFDRLVKIASSKCYREGGLLSLAEMGGLSTDRQKMIEAANASVRNVVIAEHENLFLLKNPAFSEEDEYRIISNLILHPKSNCLYRVSGNRIIPYQILNLPDLGIPRIEKVIIGPKNPNPIWLIKAFLIQNGFENVELVASSATFR